MRERKDREDRDDMTRGDGMGEKRGFFRKRGCRFCADHELMIDHKDRQLMRPFITERFKIVPRRISGVCAKHQRQLSLAIKRARHIAVISYSTSQLWSKGA